MEPDPDHDEPAFVEKQEETDPEVLERQETAKYFWQAIVVLLIMIVVVSLVIHRIHPLK